MSVSENASNLQLDKDGSIIIETIKSYKKIILWGAGNLGNEMKLQLNKLNINVDEIWDVNIVGDSIDGIMISKPLSSVSTKDTIVLICISNQFSIEETKSKLDELTYNYIDAYELYQELFCPISIDKFDTEVCSKFKHCNPCNCKKLFNLSKEINNENNKPALDSVSFVVTQRCSLKCKYCIALVNSYECKDKIDFDTERILKDIDLIMNSTSFIARATVFGGEPFLHKDIDLIVKKLISKDNIGVISIPTNGVFKIDDEKIQSLVSNKIRVDYSNYSKVLNQSQIDLVNDNLDRMIRAGVNVNMTNITPEWLIPGKLTQSDLSASQLEERKTICFSKHRDYIVKNGKFYPCLRSDSVHSLHLEDDEDNYVVLDNYSTSEELSNAILTCINQKYYTSCRRCGVSDVISESAEQGYYDFFKED